jgi:hypothetical protein
MILNFIKLKRLDYKRPQPFKGLIVVKKVLPIVTKALCKTAREEKFTTRPLGIDSFPSRPSPVSWPRQG